MDRSVAKIGAGAAMLGAVLALVFNILHPRSSDIGTASEELELITDNGIWLFDHYMIGWAVGIVFLGLLVFTWTFAAEPARSWARVARALLVGSTTLVFATVAIDGQAGNAIAEQWETTQQKEAAVFVADMVFEIGTALFTSAIASFFGLMPIVFGVAILSGREHPPWLGWVPIVSGIVGIVTATIQYFDGLSNTTTNVLFPISSILLTIWVFVVGWRLWQTTATAAPAAAARPETV